MLFSKNNKFSCLDKGDDGDWIDIEKDELDKFYSLISYKIDSKEEIGLEFHFNNDTGIVAVKVPLQIY